MPMQQIAIVLGLLAAVAGAIPLAARLNIAYPIVLVLGGLALGFIPFVPNVTLDPELVLLVFLPPLLYWEAVNTSWRDFRANIRPISSLAIGLVIGTTGGVALVGHYLLDLPWTVAFVLGAVVSPTDAVAATAIASRLGLPQRLITIIQGESLVNDASALVIYKTAVAAVVAGSFSLPRAGGQFIFATVAGIAIGVVTGALFSRLRTRIHDTRVEGTLSLLIPFLVYLPADLAGASGVLATVTAGLVIGRRSPITTAPEARLQIGAIWDLGTFLLNGLAFILIGLEFQEILRALDRDPLPLLLRDIAVVSLAVIVVRIIWVFPSNALARLFQRKRKREAPASKRELSVVAWTGLRGVIALAVALALPETAGDQPFPYRSLIIFVTFGVIIVTLVGQGLTLPPLIRLLSLSSDDNAAREEGVARAALARAALGRLDEWDEREGLPAHLLQELRGRYERRLARIEEAERVTALPQAVVIPQLLTDLRDTQRRTLIELRNRNVISDGVLRLIQRELDLEQLRLVSSLPQPEQDPGA
jgi:Na+/H+ antiporter